MTRKALTTVASPREKSSEKSSATGKPFVRGDPRRKPGRGPAKGAPNAGRPPNSFREFMRTLREDDATLRGAIATAARDPESRAFGHVLKLVSSYDEDGPDQRVTVESIRQRVHQQVRIIRDVLPPAQSAALLEALDPVWR